VAAVLLGNARQTDFGGRLCRSRSFLETVWKTLATLEKANPSSTNR